MGFGGRSKQSSQHPHSSDGEESTHDGKFPVCPWLNNAVPIQGSINTDYFLDGIRRLSSVDQCIKLSTKSRVYATWELDSMFRRR